MTEIELQEIENPLGLKLVLRLFFLNSIRYNVNGYLLCQESF